MTAIAHLVDILNQSINVRCHYQQIPDRSRIGIPVRVRRVAWNHNRGAGRALDFVVSDTHDEPAFEHIPRLVIAVMQVQWSDQARWPLRRTSITPLGDDEIAARRPDYVSCEYWSGL